MSMSPSNEVAQGANGVKGSAEIMMAKYADAVRSTSNAENNAHNLFNKGLAQVLNEDYTNAISSFEQAASADSSMGIAHYGAAIASAHLGNESDVFEHLSAAFAADPDLKQEAMNDLEFATYATSQQFQDILK